MLARVEIIDPLGRQVMTNDVMTGDLQIRTEPEKMGDLIRLQGAGLVGINPNDGAVDVRVSSWSQSRSQGIFFSITDGQGSLRVGGRVPRGSRLEMSLYEAGDRLIINELFNITGWTVRVTAG